jgi:hypothetical protein
LAVLIEKYHLLCRFIYTLLGLGIVMCSLTCSGHVAAETANGPCLSCVSFKLFDTWSCISVFSYAEMAAATILSDFRRKFHISKQS